MLSKLRETDISRIVVSPCLGNRTTILVRGSGVEIGCTTIGSLDKSVDVVAFFVVEMLVSPCTYFAFSQSISSRGLLNIASFHFIVFLWISETLLF